jgi:hypothetical protein
MTPQIKATLVLPFAIAAIATILFYLTIHPMIFVWLLVIPSAIAFIAFSWYSLYVLFGGEVQ